MARRPQIRYFASRSDRGIVPMLNVRAGRP